MTRRVLRRLLGASAAAGGAAWGLTITVNDEWDHYFPPAAPEAPPGVRERVVVLGTGWGALEVVRKLSPEHDVVMVSPRPHFTYTPLLAGASVGTVSRQTIVEPVRDFLKRENTKKKGARHSYVQGTCEDLNLEKKTVTVRRITDASADDKQDFEIDFDKLVVAVGAQTATFGIPGVSQHALFLKEVSDAAAVRRRLLNCLEKASSLLSESAVRGPAEAPKLVAKAEQLLNFMVVGGGPTGVELSGELADFIRTDVRRNFGDALADKVKINLVEAMPRILGPFDPALGEYAVQHLTGTGVSVQTNTAVKRVLSSTSAVIQGQDGTEAEVDFGFLVWAAGIATRPFSLKVAEKLGQYTPGEGRPPRGIAVDGHLRVKVNGEKLTPAAAENARSSVYAIGDCAVSGHAPTAQVAAQEGKYLGRVLRDGFHTTCAHPDAAPAAAPFAYNHNGSMAFLGNRSAIAQIPGGHRPAMNYMWRTLHGADRGVPEADTKAPDQHLTGAPAFVFWRSVYFSKLLSSTNRLSIASDWISAELFGRNVVNTNAPHMERKLD